MNQEQPHLLLSKQSRLKVIILKLHLGILKIQSRVKKVVEKN
jgi:hypothetical protein